MVSRRLEGLSPSSRSAVIDSLNLILSELVTSPKPTVPPKPKVAAVEFPSSPESPQPQHGSGNNSQVWPSSPESPRPQPKGKDSEASDRSVDGDDDPSEDSEPSPPLRPFTISIDVWPGQEVRQ